MFVFVVIAQAMGSAILASAGTSSLEFAVIPVPVAIYAAMGRTRRAGALVAAAALGCAFTVIANYSVEPLYTRVHWAVLPYYVGVSALGLIMGIGIRRRWGFGSIVASVVAPAFASICVIIVLFARDWWMAEAAMLFHYMESSLGEASGEDQQRLIARLEWLFLEHWVDLGFGVFFWQVLIMACISVTVASRWARARGGLRGPRGFFRHMRPPDWLVWGVIAAANLWFADRQWPGIGLRPYAWNAAITLAAVYWVNGLSVVAYGLRLWRPHPMVATAGFAAVVILAGFQTLCMIGLFDTWFSFRSKLRAWKISRQLAQATRRDDG